MAKQLCLILVAISLASFLLDTINVEGHPTSSSK